MRSLTGGEKTLAERCRELVAGGRHTEEIIAFLRAEGCGKTMTIAILADALETGLTRAKELVHFSATWADVRARDERFHEVLALDLGSIEQERKE